MSTGKRLSFDFVKQFFLNHNCELLETEYKNARTKMRYRCSCGTVSSIVFDSFQRGNRCRKCGNIKISKSLDKKRITQEQAIDYFKSQGCELLDIFKKSYIPMSYRCSCGKISKINWNNFKRGRRCLDCGTKRRSGENHYEWIPDRNAFKEFNDFRQKCYKALKASLFGKKKCGKTEKLLGYSIQEFQNYIKSHPNWKNVEGKRWHLDHIFPISAFRDYGVLDPKIVNCLDNLQPLLYKENLLKQDIYDPCEFEKWLISKGIQIRNL